MFSKLQYISQGKTSEEQFGNIQQVLEAGCRWIQLRFKNVDEKELCQLAAGVKKLCAKHKAIFIVNDFPRVAEQVGADGVHLGLTDMKISEARKIIGEKIIGGTANTLEDVLMRAEERFDYIGLGPFRFTATKENLSSVLGIEGYRKIMNVLREKEISIPVLAIGGILAEDVPTILETGIYGVAVSSAINQTKNKTRAIKKFIRELSKFTLINSPYAKVG